MALADYIHNKPVIETDRLVLRPLVYSDIPALKEWMPDKSIYTYWGKGPGKSEKNPELIFEKEEKTTSCFSESRVTAALFSCPEGVVICIRAAMLS